MHKNEELILKFYQSFASNNVERMLECYHENIVFHDPAFGTLKAEKAKSMWKMLLSKNDNNLKINFNSIEANELTGKANWIAEYNYGPGNRKVVNKISATFKFLDGEIIEHKDSFNLWSWTKQALGTSGYLLGWSSFMRNKIQTKTNIALTKFMNKN